jgi:hypothetical protein
MCYTYLDKQILNYVPKKGHQKGLENRDKDLSLIQRALLNSTSPLCCLHDRLERKLKRPFPGTKISKPAGASKATAGPANKQPTARLPLFLSQWQNITKDPVIIAIQGVEKKLNRFKISISQNSLLVSSF